MAFCKALISPLIIPHIAIATDPTPLIISHIAIATDPTPLIIPYIATVTDPTLPSRGSTHTIL